MRPVEIFETIEDHLAGPEIEISRRLIGQEDIRSANQSPGEHHTLLLSTRQLPRTMRRPRRKPDFFQPRQRLRGRLSLSPTPDQQWHHHVFESCKLWQKIMDLPNEPKLPVAEISLLPVRESGNLNTPIVYRTARRPVEAAHQMQQSGFAGTGFTDKRKHFATIDVQIEARKDD